MFALILTLLLDKPKQYPFYLRLENINNVITVYPEIEECKNQKIRWMISPEHGYIELKNGVIQIDPPDNRNHMIVAQGTKSFCTGWYNLRAKE